MFTNPKMGRLLQAFLDKMICIVHDSTVFLPGHSAVPPHLDISVCLRGLAAGNLFRSSVSSKDPFNLVISPRC